MDVTGDRRPALTNTLNEDLASNDTRDLSDQHQEDSPSTTSTTRAMTTTDRREALASTRNADLDGFGATAMSDHCTRTRGGPNKSKSLYEDGSETYHVERSRHFNPDRWRLRPDANEVPHIDDGPPLQ